MTKPQVYFIKPLHSGGPVKIGFSRYLEKRLAALQVGSPVPLEVEASFAGSCRAETYLHRKFCSQRIRGEWFRRSAELSAVIEHVKERGDLPLFDSKIKTGDAYFAEVEVAVKSENSQSAQFAKSIKRRASDICVPLEQLLKRAGVSNSTLWRWQSGTDPHPVTLGKIMDALDYFEGERAGQ